MSRQVTPAVGDAAVAFLRRHTTARVALGRRGAALPTVAHLDLQEAHARARDAVHSTLDENALEAAVAPLGLPVHRVASAAPDRRTYLLRPDLGRRLAPGTTLPRAEGSVALVAGDGLCAIGVGRWAPPLLHALVPLLRRDGFTPGPVVIARQARVALGDAVGEALGAAAAIVLIGERPGLSATDSLGAYVTWEPRTGRLDSERNCISNIRADGLSPVEAAAKIAWLLAAARDLGATGTALKDDQPLGQRLARTGDGASVNNS
ncbi:ethanolamine ammonia-lyase subunit EutC [Roseomonas sp. CCTCC AB2023176]|uniref:ethanolamine ammonia-lyase subunit EutC n=1 Tax=Roseomonas sp. CCTCC AB2023176 TaxID=3342640 RepID=UPI0035D8FC8B